MLQFIGLLSISQCLHLVTGGVHSVIRIVVSQQCSTDDQLQRIELVVYAATSEHSGVSAHIRHTSSMQLSYKHLPQCAQALHVACLLATAALIVACRFVPNTLCK
jgi:hypothetical protein